MNRITAIFTIFLAVLIANISVNAQTIYVSPNGNDQQNGLSQTSALRTFLAGANAARKAGQGSIVEFAGGIYIFNQTVILDASYSGLTFKAADGQKPIFTSLLPVTGWKAHSQNIIQAPSPLPKGTQIRYLQDGHQNWLERSATAWFRTEETTENPENSYHEPQAQPNKLNIQHPVDFGTNIDWSNANQYDLRASQTGWNQEILPIKSYNSQENRIYTQIPANYEMRSHATEVIWPNRNWVMNTIAGIDEPGEWVIIDDIIYLWPKGEVNDIYVPQLTELIRIDATGGKTSGGNKWQGKPVQNITFDGITMTGGDFYALQPDDIATTHDWDVVDAPTSLLRFRNVENSAIINCTFTKSGGAAIRLDRHAQNITIANNKISYMGRSGISLIGRAPGYGDVNHHNKITGNVIKSIGREKWTSIAINLDQSSHNLISHNYIEDTYFSAITITAPKQFVFMHHVWGTYKGDTWQGRDFHARDINPAVYADISEDPISTFDQGTWQAMQHLYSGNNVIENNAFINVNSGQGYLTQSGIYMSGITRGQTTYVRRNYFYDSIEATTNSSILWADSDQSNTDWIGNMVFNIDIEDNEPEPNWVYRANPHYQGADDDVLHAKGDRALIKANITFDSKYTAHTGFDINDYRLDIGNISNETQAEEEFLIEYIASWQAICPRVVAGQTLPKANIFQFQLAEIIEQLSGERPQCGQP